jgi:hypothetical protein
MSELASELTSTIWILTLLIVAAVLFLVPAWWRVRDRRALLRLVADALERDRPLSPELVQALPGGRRAPPVPDSTRDLRRGTMLIATGLAVILIGVAVGTAAATSSPTAGLVLACIVGAFGVMPACVGVAYVVLGGMQRRAESR